MRKEKSKIIESYIVLEHPNRLMKFITISNNIDSVICDLQEEYPEERITRKSVIKWKFLTIADLELLKKEHNIKLP
jgi:hypothetical protein